MDEGIRGSVSDWNQRGCKCPEGEDSDAWVGRWFPTTTEPRLGHDGSELAWARMQCRSCPLQLPCLDYAVRTEQPDGVWGASTPRERHRMRARGYTGAAEMFA